MDKIIKKFPGRSTDQGAFTQTCVMNALGDVLIPQTKNSKTGKHWEDQYFLPNDKNAYPIVFLTKDITNSGKNNSFWEILPEGAEPLPCQKRLIRELEEEGFTPRNPTR